MPTLNGTNNNGAVRFEASSVVFDTNLFNGSAYGNPGEQRVDLFIPLEQEGLNCAQAIVDGQCRFVFSGDRNGTPENTDFRVISYPRGFLGSMGGRFCTGGFECGNFSGDGTLAGRRAQGVGEESPVFDLRIPQNEIGLPNSVNNINSLRLTASSNHCAGSRPFANYFVDAYIYDTTQHPPLARYSGTINGINDKFNRMWNTNIWFGHPNQDAMWAARQANNVTAENSAITQFTGGQVMTGDFRLEPGGDIYKLVFKHEDIGGNNFFYVGFVRVEMADGTIPDTTDFSLEYRSILDYIEGDLFWDLVQNTAQGQSIVQAMATNPVRPLNIVRPNGNLFLDGVAMGNESFGQPDGNSGTICWDEMRWDLNGQTFGGKSDVCRLPFTVNNFVNARCRLPFTILGNFDCALPFSISGGRLPGPEATCDQCPQALTLPKLVVGYGQFASLNPLTYFQFPEGTSIDILDAEVVSGNLTGDLSLSLISVGYTAPDDGSCNTQCGKVKVSYRFSCPDGDGFIENCCLECQICSFPGVSDTLGDEIMFMTSEISPLIRVGTPIDLSQPICDPITQPPVGELQWVGNGWQFNAPVGWWGTFDVVVPAYANGDKAHENLRCVTICRQGPLRLENTPACRTVVFIKEKSLTGDSWIPAVKIRSMNLNIQSFDSGNYIDYETCNKVILDQLRQEWSGSLSGKYLCGDRRIYTGRDIEIRLDKDVSDPDTPRFYGKARVQSAATVFQYNTDTNDNEQQISFSLEGHGEFYSTGWAL